MNDVFIRELDFHFVVVFIYFCLNKIKYKSSAVFIYKFFYNLLYTQKRGLIIWCWYEPIWCIWSLRMKSVVKGVRAINALLDVKSSVVGCYEWIKESARTLRDVEFCFPWFPPLNEVNIWSWHNTKHRDRICVVFDCCPKKCEPLIMVIEQKIAWMLMKLILNGTR